MNKETKDRLIGLKELAEGLIMLLVAGLFLAALIG